MIPSRSPELTATLLVAAGSLGSVVTTLLSECDVRSHVVPIVGWEAVDIGDYRAVALATDRPYPAIATRLDDACWSEGIPWLEATHVAHRFRVGPVIIPNVTPCYACWRSRVRSHNWHEREFHDRLDHYAAEDPGQPWFEGELAPAVDEVGAIATAEVAALTTRTYPPADHRMGRYWEGDGVYGTLSSRLYSPIGGCHRCGRNLACSPDAG